MCPYVHTHLPNWLLWLIMAPLFIPLLPTPSFWTVEGHLSWAFVVPVKVNIQAGAKG